MITAIEVITNVKNLRNGGKASDESELSDSQLMFIIDYYRATLIRQQQKLGQTINPFLKQDFTVKMKFTGCDHVSVETLPKPIELHNSEMITQVGDGYNQRMTSHAASWYNYAKYTSKEVRWFIKGDRLYINNYYDTSAKLYIEGVWERPSAIEEIKGTINPMKPFEFTYPISSTMLEQLYKLIASGEERWRMEFKDNTNNSNEDRQQ